MTQTLADFSATRLDGTPEALAEYQGQLVMVVNVASKCGLTPQYEGLEALYRQYRDRGFVVLGFPCNQFAEQEPGSNAEIAAFCALNYGVSFPMFSRIAVNGPDAHPLYAWLKSTAPGPGNGDDIEWNFAKFLLGRDGRVLRRYAPGIEPAQIDPDLAALL